MSQNQELVQALKRVLADSEFIIKTLAQNVNTDVVNSTNLHSVIYNLDSTSGCVVRGLFEVLDYVDDAIDQFDN